MEFVKLGSNEESYFSQKRIHQGIAFSILQWGLVHWLILNVSKIDSTNLLVWASVECVICGYVIREIQKEKLENK